MDDMLSLNQKLMQDIVIRKWSTLASLAVLLYEYIIMLSQEIRYIWRPSVTAVRLIYILSRYVGIITQSINIYLVFWPLSSTDIPERRCKIWFIFQIAAMCLLMAALDSILMLRVYALHNKDRRVGALLVVLFCGQIGVDVVCSERAVNMPYNGVCDSKTQPYVAYFCISVWATHICLGVLTVVKCDLTRMKMPVIRVVTRDGAWIMFIVCSLFTTLAPYALIGQVSKAHMLFGWPISILSISCCRMIMNMQTLDVTEGSSTDIENLTELILTELHTLQLELQEQ